MNIIFTDGSSRGNPGPGGWGSVVVTRVEEGKQTAESAIIELGGVEKETTNNRMEIKAAIGGLGATEAGAEVTVYTDSSYLINGITKWIKGWKRNGWITKAKEDVLNKDLWMELDALAKDRAVTWKYVGGHVGIIGNERCDTIATAFADGVPMNLYKGLLNTYSLPNILDISHNEGLQESKKSSSSHSRAKAFSYVSSVGGVIRVHHSWVECEKLVKGARGARYKKAVDAGEEKKIVEEFEAFLV